MSTILVDMDGVLVDWGRAYDQALDYVNAPENIPRHNQQRGFDLFAGLSPREAQFVWDAMTWLDYADMYPIEGYEEAIMSMRDANHTVFLCTSPWYGNENCLTGKAQWVVRNLGAGWLDQLIITKDKTMVHGDILIDDKPEIGGNNPNPSWTHVLFDQPYNQHVTGQPRLMSWGDWDNERFGRISA